MKSDMVWILKVLTVRTVGYFHPVWTRKEENHQTLCCFLEGLSNLFMFHSLSSRILEQWLHYFFQHRIILILHTICVWTGMNLALSQTFPCMQILVFLYTVVKGQDQEMTWNLSQHER